MPLYDYSCSTCGTFEVLLPRPEETTPCPCGRPAKRQWGPPILRPNGCLSDDIPTGDNYIYTKVGKHNIRFRVQE